MYDSYHHRSGTLIDSYLIKVISLLILIHDIVCWMSGYPFKSPPHAICCDICKTLFVMTGRVLVILYYNCPVCQEDLFQLVLLSLLSSRGCQVFVSCAVFK